MLLTLRTFVGNVTRGHLVWLALGLIVLLASAGRWYSASRLFDPSSSSAGRLSGDEVVYLLLGDRLWHEHRYTTRGIEHLLPLETMIPAPYLQGALFKHPPVFPLLVGASRLAGGGELWAAFVPNLVLSALSLVVLFALAREVGLSREASLLPVVLLAVSPLHWVCSARIWLDLPVSALVLTAVWCQLRGVQRPRWMVASGLFWACAILTKYVALPALLGSVVALVATQRQVLRSRAFWGAHALTVLLCVPWIVIRAYVEGPSALAFWTSGIDDWRTLTRISRSLWLLPVLVGAVLLLWRAARAADVHRAAAFTLLLATGAFACAYLWNAFGWAMSTGSAFAIP